MGVLETRCLDFKRILMLSVGEGILPEKPSEASFIPTLIRREYGLTTPEKKISVYAYYFYRLLQRAERVRLVYNDSVEGVAKGEMSRFMKTLLVEHGERLGIEQLRIESVPRIFRPERENAPLATIGEEPLFRKFSPSALKTYFRCKKMFYYKYVLRLKTPQRQDPIINSNDFGTVFHRAAELLLTVELDGMNHPITPGRIRRFFENGGIAKLRDYTLRAFEEKNIKSSEITVSAIVRYLRMLFEYEAGGRDGIAPATSFLIKAVEGKYRTVLPVPFGEDGRDVPIVLEGDIDRLDEATLADGTRLLRVVDYKTGKKKLSNNKPINCTIEGFFTPSADYPANELQVFVYALMFANEPKAVAPLLYYIPACL